MPWRRTKLPIGSAAQPRAAPETFFKLVLRWGVYWIPLFQILEDRGFEVCLVNARHVKNVPGRRTDVSDCQWLQFLHSVGLLRASYRPDQEICAVRSLLRHRESLVQMGATHVNH